MVIAITGWLVIYPTQWMIWHEAIRFGELFVRRERAVGGKKRLGGTPRPTIVTVMAGCPVQLSCEI